MGAKPYELPSSEGLVVGSNIESKYKESEYNVTTGKYEEVEKTSTLGKYKGGNILGWNLYGEEKSKIIFYDNSEKAEGNNYGYITFNEHESIRDWFTSGIKFERAIWVKVVEGKVKGVIFLDIE